MRRTSVVITTIITLGVMLAAGLWARSRADLGSERTVSIGSAITIATNHRGPVAIVFEHVADEGTATQMAFANLGDMVGSTSIGPAIPSGGSLRVRWGADAMVSVLSGAGSQTPVFNGFSSGTVQPGQSVSITPAGPAHMVGIATVPNDGRLWYLRLERGVLRTQTVMGPQVVPAAPSSPPAPATAPPSSPAPTGG